MGLRSLGMLEALELAAYDLCVRLRPDVSEPDPRIVLVTVTEDDIRKQGRWPLTDDVLAQALEILSQSYPRAIGVDIYRDIPVPPGHDRLNAILTNNRRIIVTTKFADDPASAIPPPPILKGTEQVGFNDIPIDADGIVRRGLLLMDDGKQTLYSFSLRQALLYLQAEGIMPQPDPSNPEHMRLGQTTFHPFESNDGAYVGADAGDTDLARFQRCAAPLRSFTITALISGEVPAAVIKDRVVLIGVNTESVKDFFYTPHSRGLRGQAISGVELHAQVVSQT